MGNFMVIKLKTIVLLFFLEIILVKVSLAIPIGNDEQPISRKSKPAKSTSGEVNGAWVVEPTANGLQGILYISKSPQGGITGNFNASQNGVDAEERCQGDVSGGAVSLVCTVIRPSNGWAAHSFMLEVAGTRLKGQLVAGSHQLDVLLVRNDEDRRMKAESARAAEQERAAAQAKREAEEREAEARAEREAKARAEREAKARADEERKQYVSHGGLTWMPAKFTKNWNDANKYCNNTVINGQSGWRLPTQDELSALYASGAMNNRGWSLFYTWSSTPDGSGKHYLVSLDYGGVHSDGDTNLIYVTCVR